MRPNTMFPVPPAAAGARTPALDWVVNSAISKCIYEMVNEKSKVVISYTSGMADMTIETRLSLDGRFQQLSFFLPFNFNFSISVLLHIFRIVWFHQVL